MKLNALTEVSLALPTFEKPVMFDSISRQELHDTLVAYFVDLIPCLDIDPKMLIFRNEHTLAADYEQIRNVRYQISLLHGRIAEFILTMPSVQDSEVPGSTISIYVQRTIEDCFNIAVKQCLEA